MSKELNPFKGQRVSIIFPFHSQSIGDSDLFSSTGFLGCQETLNSLGHWAEIHLGFRLEDFRFRAEGLVFRVEVFGFGVQTRGLGLLKVFRVEGLGLGFRVQVLGFWGCQG